MVTIAHAAAFTEEDRIPFVHGLALARASKGRFAVVHAKTRDAEPTALDASEQPPYWIAGNALQAANARGIDTVGLTVHGKDGRGVGYFEDDTGRFRLTPRHWAYLRVSEGCNQKCAFCTIPSIRGKMRSKPPQTIAAHMNPCIGPPCVESGATFTVVSTAVLWRKLNPW